MAKHTNKRSLSPRVPRTAGIGHLTPNPSNAPPVVEADDVDVTKKFMRENPKGSIADPVEENPDVVFVPSVDGEVVETVAETPNVESEAPVAPEVEPELKVPAQAVEAKEKAPKPTAEVAGEKPQTPDKAEVVAAVEPPKPSYAPDEKIFLLDGSDPWTREQVVAGLQERATLQPKAEEAERFRSLFGYDYSGAEQQWKPVLDILRQDPERTKLLDEALHADAGLLDYLRRSAEFYKSLPAEERGSQPAAPAQPTHDPRIDQYEKTIKAMQTKMAQDRARTEWDTAFAKYPFLRDDLKSRAALQNAASLLFTNDEKSGKDPFECRGLLEAMAENQVFLEAMDVAYQQRHAAVPQRETPIEPRPGVGAEAILGSTGPGPAVTAPAKPKPYRGNPEQAVKAFIQDHPGT